MKTILALVLTVCLALCSKVAMAAESEQIAEQFFSAGSAAYTRGDFRAAAEAFESAHRHAPRAATILNAARSWDAAKESARAAGAYSAALKLGGLSEDERKLAAARLAELSQSLGTVKVSGPAGSVISLGHVKQVAVPTTVYLPPGAYAVEVLFPSGARRNTPLSVRLGEQQLEVAPPPTPTQTSPPPDRAAAPVPVLEEGSSAQVTWGFVSLGAGAALAGGAVFVGLGALDARDRYDASEQRDLDARDEAKSLRLWTNVLWAGALVASGVGVTLILTAPSSEPQHGVVLAPGSVAWMSQF